ncbi:MarR family winged helix-turn-helix transcriptional regulator [Sphingomonas bacterium]|uniref:MarR family winged helix-turn-helix transcriptional regulator n=1 Tax=Sphingomonas bacterium TaxID=1895847 RepID=UPI0015775F26|nr:MarR family transcriptional regulator [Sphingomonas bacterium]
MAERGDGPDAQDSLRRSIGVKLILSARRLVQRFDQSVERLGVSRAKFRVIAVVSRNPGATQRMIAETLEITEVTAGRLVERLCADGLLERRKHASDRRARCIHLTAAAQPTLRRLALLAAAQEEETFVGFSDAELATLASLLDRLSGNIASAGVRRLAADADIRPSVRTKG